MRYFKLKNSADEVWDITTTGTLFHDPSGLGFEEDNDFRPIGENWWLNKSSFKQGVISGNIIFTENPETIGDFQVTEPYEKYHAFYRFIQRSPLTLMYYPYGLEDGTVFNRRVRVSKLEKTEKTQLGVIDSAIEFTAYTPWYEIRTYAIEQTDVDDSYAWIWGTTQECPPIIFEPQGATISDDAHTVVIPPYEGNYCRPKFRDEAIEYVRAVIDTTVKSPVKLTLEGPLSSPVWYHRISTGEDSYKLVASGAFSTNVNILAGEKLVIDGTEGKYSITKIGVDGSETNLYALRDFSTQCFLSLQEGENYIMATSSGGAIALNIKVEAHVYYATV